jgi:hypothetical protein
MWFEKLTGFVEESPGQVRANLEINDKTITSRVNGKSVICGQLEIPSLAELQSEVLKSKVPSGQMKIREVIGDAKALHSETSNAGALFQVASQFNLLEMPSQHVTPERGVDVYEYDATQGPACAVAAGAGTIYRNYFARVNGMVGQSADHQIDCLYDLGVALGNANETLWQMQNGYAMASASGLIKVSETITAMSDIERDALRELLRIGIQWDTQVILDGCEHLVTQAYCSALPVAYSEHADKLWEAFARLVLEASYEATLCAGALNFSRTGNNKIYLTLLGGGVFGNHDDWIFSAIQRALDLFRHIPLDVALVSYRVSKPRVSEFVDLNNHG